MNPRLMKATITTKTICYFEFDPDESFDPENPEHLLELDVYAEIDPTSLSSFWDEVGWHVTKADPEVTIEFEETDPSEVESYE